MLAKIIVIILMLIIISALCNGLICLIRGKNTSMTKALTWRICISIALFVFLFLAFKFHLIQPHGILGSSHALHM